ncbi:hypothetical protein [Sorangium cellulosum]|uniref:hypothetical protein n=1 Tax=Sorangium cellulosum TaxID=56 RepID=UPI000CF499FD|nr:hypothetical protein [Sorangium cellulosum]
MFIVSVGQSRNSINGTSLPPTSSWTRFDRALSARRASRNVSAPFRRPSAVVGTQSMPRGPGPSMLYSYRPTLWRPTNGTIPFEEMKISRPCRARA